MVGQVSSWGLMAAACILTSAWEGDGLGTGIEVEVMVVGSEGTYVDGEGMVIAFIVVWSGLCCSILVVEI